MIVVVVVVVRHREKPACESATPRWQWVPRSLSSCPAPPTCTEYRYSTYMESMASSRPRPHCLRALGSKAAVVHFYCSVPRIADACRRNEEKAERSRAMNDCSRRYGRRADSSGILGKFISPRRISPHIAKGTRWNECTVHTMYIPGPKPTAVSMRCPPTPYTGQSHQQPATLRGNCATRPRVSPRRSPSRCSSMMLVGEDSTSSSLVIDSHQDGITNFRSADEMHIPKQVSSVDPRRMLPTYIGST